MDISDDGPELNSGWLDAANNLCGILRGRGTSAVAELFVGAGWSSRSSSWEGYEVETRWCRVELDPLDRAETLLNGVVDPGGLDGLASLLSRSGVGFVLELYDESGDLLREITG
ncbi:hypothetical protein [Streptomyces sp. WELS2]|uniref:hypothetical protein n=1 Tax=Streptomyces sp. WELS2 TaxID=2749435 RepID=UPI0015F078CA|nr:hypothetical protein [Streptomyces sp. WELS2]